MYAIRSYYACPRQRDTKTGPLVRIACRNDAIAVALYNQLTHVESQTAAGGIGFGRKIGVKNLLDMLR